MYKKFLEIWLFCATIFAFPSLVLAEVKINEVAWMGTSASQYEEWIELYNDGDDLSLSGWKIYKGGGETLLISLSGSISSGQYLLVCRTTASVPSPLNGSCNIKGAFGGSGLNNTSEHIVLKNNSGLTVDEINASSGWPAGEASSKKTMQKSGGLWITAVGTPGEINATSGSSTSENDEQEENTDEELDGFVDSSKKDKKIFPNMLLKLEFPKTAFVGTPIRLKAQALDYDRSTLFRGHYFWNMGDGNKKEQYFSGSSTKNDGLIYVFDHPGTYTVSVKYHLTFFEDVPPDLQDKFIIEVINPTITISKVYPDGSVEMKNVSNTSVDVSGWKIKDHFDKTFIIPNDTFVSPSKSITFSNKILGLNFYDGVSLFTPADVFVFGTSNPKQEPRVKNNISVTSNSKSKDEQIEVIEEPIGEILGVQEDSEKDEKNIFSDSLIYIFLFVAIVFVALVGIMFLRKENNKEDQAGYELIED